MGIIRTCATALLFLHLPSAIAQASSSSSPLPQATVLHQFPNGIYVENFVLRQNGGILVSTLSAPETIYLDPVTPNDAVVIANYPPPATGVLGIAEFGQGVFYVASNAYSFQEGRPPANGTGQIWKLDLNSCEKPEDASLKLVANLTGSGLLDGLAAIPNSETLLVADAFAGVIWNVNVITGDVRAVINDSLTAPTSDISEALQIGPDGLAILDGYVYWTNDALQLLARAPIDGDGLPTGPSEVLVSGASMPEPDDLAFTGANDTAYIADGGLNAVQLFDGSNIHPIVSIGSPASVRLAPGGKRIYIGNTGNPSAYAEDPVPVGGSISFFDLC